MGRRQNGGDAHAAPRADPDSRPDGNVLPNSIAETKYVRLGGVDQWVMIRGENVANPPLIVLHGGPGMSEMGFFRHFNAPLERHFTVVHWDQFDALVAPSKKLVWFDHSGHEAFVDEPEKFNATMVKLVRPLASLPATESAPLPVSA